MLIRPLVLCFDSEISYRAERAYLATRASINARCIHCIGEEGGQLGSRFLYGAASRPCVLREPDEMKVRPLPATICLPAVSPNSMPSPAEWLWVGEGGEVERIP